MTTTTPPQHAATRRRDRPTPGPASTSARSRRCCSAAGRSCGAAARASGADPRLHRGRGATMAEHRERVLEQLQLLVARGRRAAGVPGAPRRRGRRTAATSPASRSSSPPTRRCRSRRACSGGCSRRRSCTWAPPSSTTGCCPARCTIERPRRVRDDRDRPRLGRRSIGTTATYDPDDRGVRPPHPVPRRRGRTTSATRPSTARPPWCSPSSITRGVDHGVHAFYVPIRETRRTRWSSCPASAARTTASRAGSTASTTGGCTSTTCASRARTCSTGTARSPRTAPTPRRSRAPAAGSSPCSAPSCRAACPSTAPRSTPSKIALAIAITLRQPAPPVLVRRPATEEVVLLDYAEHQRRLLPLLAQTYARHFAHERLLDLVPRRVLRRGRHPRGPARTSRRMAAALKPASTWHALDDAPDGARGLRRGRASSPRTGSSSLRADLDVYVTFEGDNTVLLQLVGKRLLADYAAGFKDIDGRHGRAFVAGRAADAALYRTPLAPGRADPGRTAATCAARPATCGRPRRSASCSPTGSRRWSPSSPHALRPARRPPAPRRPRRCSTSTSTSSSRRPARTPTCVQWEAFTQGARGGRRPRHPPGAHLAAGPLRPVGRSSATSPGTSSTAGSRPARARTVTSYIDRLLTRGCARTRRTSSTRSATGRSTSGHRSRPAPRRSGRTRRAANYRGCGRPATRPVPEKAVRGLRRPPRRPTAPAADARRGGGRDAGLTPADARPTAVVTLGVRFGVVSCSGGSAARRALGRSCLRPARDVQHLPGDVAGLVRAKNDTAAAMSSGGRPGPPGSSCATRPTNSSYGTRGARRSRGSCRCR